MDAVVTARNEAVQRLAQAHGRSMQSSDAHASMVNECGLYDKLAQAMQELMIFAKTEPDRMRSYAAGAAGVERSSRDKNALEFKVVQNLGKVDGDKAKFRQWNHRFKSALRLVNKEYIDIMEKVDKELDIGRPMDAGDVKLDSGQDTDGLKLDSEPGDEDLRLDAEGSCSGMESSCPGME